MRAKTRKQLALMTRHLIRAQNAICSDRLDTENERGAVQDDVRECWQIIDDLIKGQEDRPE